LAAESASRLDARVRGRDKRLSREVRVLSLAAQVQPRARKTSGARLVELPGTDHLFFVDDAGDRAIAEIEEFLTGSRSAPVVDRVLTTVVFTGNAGGQLPAAFDADQRVLRAMEDQGRNSDRRKDSGNVTSSIPPSARTRRAIRPGATFSKRMMRPSAASSGDFAAGK
jgi:hypothetical protein